MRTFLVRLGLAALLAALALLGILLAVLPGRSEEREHSTYSFEPEGLRALFLVCEELGLPVTTWTDAPAHLSAAGTLLVLAELPEAPPALPPALASGEGLAFRQSRALVHYGSFVEQGGTLLVLGVSNFTLETLEQDLGLACLEPLEFRSDPLYGGPLVLNDGEELDFEEGPTGKFGAWGALARDVAGGWSGAVLPCGAGRVALLALPAERFDNAHLRTEPDHALLFVRSLEALAPFERVAFDEYAVGGWQPDSVPALAFQPRLAALSLHALLLLLVLVWRGAWSGPFPRDPAPGLAASALARARGFGSLLVRAGRFDLLAGFLRAAWLERRDARAGPRGAAVSTEERLALLAGGDERRRARLVELLQLRRPTSERELEALARDLDGLEAELVALWRPSSRRVSERLAPPPS